MAKDIYRKSALDRLATPEQLDLLLRVTSTRGWIALLAVCLLLGAAVTWSIVGSIPTRENGIGILQAHDGLMRVIAPGTGRLARLTARAGDTLAAGQVVAEIDKGDIADQVAASRSRLDDLRSRQAVLDEQGARELELEIGALERDRQRLGTSLEYHRQRLQRLIERRSATEELVGDGMATRIDLDLVEREIEVTALAIETDSGEISRLTSRELELRFDFDSRRLERQGAVDDARRDLELVQARLEREGRVTSPYAGRVVEVWAAEGMEVAEGAMILLLEPPGGAEAADLEAVLYVSAESGKLVERGMPVELSPTTIKKEEYGFILGSVTRVAEVPTSRAAMIVAVAELELADTVTQQVGLPLEVRVALQEDPSTTSGFKWSSRRGPPLKVTAGTVCTGSITIRHQRPITLVIPYLKKKTGLE